MQSSNKWYVITGGPSSGKTTLLAELAKRGYGTVQEAARTVIDEAIERGISPTELRKDEQTFQEVVTRRKQEIEQATAQDIVTFFDRGMHDSWAYMRYYGFELADWLRELHDISTYRRVFLLEPLAVYENDYARTESDDFAAKIHTFLHDAYTDFGMLPVLVPAMSVEDRVEFVLKHVDEDNET